MSKISDFVSFCLSVSLVSVGEGVTHSLLWNLFPTTSTMFRWAAFLIFARTFIDSHSLIMFHQDIHSLAVIFFFICFPLSNTERFMHCWHPPGFNIKYRYMLANRCAHTWFSGNNLLGLHFYIRLFQNFHRKTCSRIMIFRTKVFKKITISAMMKQRKIFTYWSCFSHGDETSSSPPCSKSK